MMFLSFVSTAGNVCSDWSDWSKCPGNCGITKRTRSCYDAAYNSTATTNGNGNATNSAAQGGGGGVKDETEEKLCEEDKCNAGGNL